jgi:hypothetical protein
LVQDYVDVFPALVQQLSVEESLVLDDRLAVENHQVLEALGHGVTSFRIEENCRNSGMTIKPTEFEENSGGIRRANAGQ